MQRTDGTPNDSGHPNVRTFREDCAMTLAAGLLANPATTGTDTQVGPSVVFTAVSLTDQLIAELAKEKQS